MSENIGMMSGAFFVGKVELLKWLNDFFKAGYTKVEETCTGAMHCQILDAIYPGQVPLHKVNFNAKFDYEYVNNFKILQKVFDKNQIKKHVDVAKLVKGKYQDNLEMLQWMKNFFDVKYGGQEYDAEARRNGAIARYGKARGVASTPSEHKSSGSKVAAPSARKTSGNSASRAKKPAPASHGSSNTGSSAAQSAKVEELNERLAKLRSTIEGLEKERNFYFGKLRDIEVLCQENEEEDAATKAKVLEILYATDDNAEFEAPAEEEEEAAPTEEAAAAGGDAEEEEEDLTF